MQDIISQLGTFIATNILEQPGRIIQPDEPLLSSGLIDSLRMMDLILFIENAFDVRIEDTEMNQDTFDTLEQLVKLVEARRP